MRIKVLPYRVGSKSVKALCEALGVMSLKLSGSKFKPSPDDVIINWGNSSHEFTTSSCTVLNRETEQATNKLKFFQRLKEFIVSPEIEDSICPDFWVDKSYIPEGAYPVVCRTILNGHSGAGIVIADGPDDVVPAPLYVKYVKKVREYRIHVGRKPLPQVSLDPLGNPDPDFEFVVISEQRKVVKHGTEPLDWRVRSHSNGFIFQRTGIDVPLSVRAAALRALEASGQDFGAVDVIYTGGGRAVVLEINSAPGLEGQTVTDYATFFKEFMT